MPRDKAAATGAEKRLSGFLYSLYGAASNAAGWHSIANLLAELYGTDSATIAVEDRFGGPGIRLSATANFSQELVKAYDAGGFKKNLWLDGARAYPGIILGSEAIPDAIFAHSEFYNETCKPLGHFYAMGAGVPLKGNGGLGLVSIHRDRPFGYFAEREKQKLRYLLPHLTQALELRARLAELELERYASLATLESLCIGVMVVNQESRILCANTVAETLIRGQQHLLLRNGRLVLKEAEQNAAFRQSIRAVALLGVGIGRGASRGTLFSVPRVGPRRLTLHVCPVHETTAPRDIKEPAAFVFVSDAKARTFSLREKLSCLYGLTIAESRLAESIAMGQSLAEFCAHADVSMNTAKTQLKHIFLKTGHRRQSQLVRDVLGNPIFHLR